MFSRFADNKNKLKWLWPWLIIIAVSLVILAPQIIGDRMIVGEDCWFHMNRAYEDMEQLKTGHFSYFLNLFSFNSSGRIVNGLYGPLGSYAEGLLLLIVKTWYRWELLNSFLVLVIAGLSVYYVARKLKTSFWPSILAGILYLTSFSFDRWVINQNFDGFGAMLLPWFLLAGYRIFRHRFSPVKLALLVAIMSQIHLMSTVIGILSLLVSFGLANCYPGRVKVWLKTLEAAGLGLLLTINVWGPLIEVKSSNRLVPTMPYHSFLSMHHAVYVQILLKPVLNHILTELFIFLILGLIGLLLRRSNLIGRFFTVQGLIFLWLSSKYFPWAPALKHYSMLASYLQFPERFLPVAIGALLLLMTQLKPKVVVISLLTFIAIINIGFDFQNERNTVNAQYQTLMRSSWDVTIKRPTSFHFIEDTLHSNDSGRFLKLAENRVPDYLPSKVLINQSNKYYQFRPDVQNIHTIINNQLPIRHTVAGRDVEVLTFNARPNHWIQLPFVKYSHTKLWLNHQVIHPKLTRINAIKIKPTQQNNVLEAQYQPSHWYELLVLAEIVTWLSIIVNECIKHVISRRF